MKMLSFLLLSGILIAGLSSQAQTPVWERYSDGLPVEGVMSMTSIGSTLFAGTDKGGVFKSVDNGNNWTAMPAHNTLKNTSSWSLASIDTFLFAGQRGGGILRSSLNGSAWTIKNSGLTNKVIQDLIAVDTTLYVATYGGGIFYSTNMGDSWSILYSNAGMEDHKVYALANNTDYLYAGTAGINSLPDTGVAYRTMFGGNDWFRVNKGFIRNGAHLDSVFSMDSNDSLVYAGTDDVGMYRSDNNGDEWKQVDAYNGDIHAIKMVGKNVYYGTTWAGVHSSFDNGKTWTANNTGLKYGNTTIPYLVKDFLVMDTVLYAATDIGVFRQPIPNVLTAISGPTTERNYISNYPNPFRSGTTISLSLIHSGRVSLKAYDAYGEEVADIINQYMDSGKHDFQFNSTALSPGIYYARLKTNEGVTTCNMIMFK